MENEINEELEKLNKIRTNLIHEFLKKMTQISEDIATLTSLLKNGE